MEIGTVIKGSQVYGKKNTLIGTVTEILHPLSEGEYTMNDIIHIEWDDRTKARFYRKDIPFTPNP